MCVIIHQPAGSKFESEYLANLYMRNDDGFGLFYAEQGQVKTWKIPEPGSAEPIQELFEKFKDRPLAMHLRLRTHGKQDFENTHPYRILSKRKHGIDLVMAHNGVFTSIPQPHKKRSDTWHFVQHFLKPIFERDPSVLDNFKFRKNLESLIGHNKVLFMDGNGKVTILNRAQGVDHKETGCWLSNSTSLEAPKTYYPSHYYDYSTPTVPVISKTPVKPINSVLYLQDGAKVWSRRVVDERKTQEEVKKAAEDLFKEKTLPKKGIIIATPTDVEKIEEAAKLLSPPFDTDKDQYVEPWEGVGEVLGDPSQMSYQEVNDWVITNPDEATEYIITRIWNMRGAF